MPLSNLSEPSALFSQNWRSQAVVDASGTPGFSSAFVAGVGPRAWVVDLRDDNDLIGPLGHIPGVARTPVASISGVVESLPKETPIVLVCDRGVDSSAAARSLREAGMLHAAYLRGGMQAWIAAGFSVSRDPSVLSRGVEAPHAGAGANGRPLVESAKVEAGLSAAQVQEHVQDPAMVPRVKLSAILRERQCSCVDGREERAIVGTPGGDSGELVLALAAYEEASGAALSDSSIAEITRGFADALGGMYLHTDNHALNTLAKALEADKRLDGSTKGLTTAQDWEAYLRKPPVGDRAAVLSHLADPGHIGCGHLRLAFSNPKAYKVRPELIRQFFQTFYSEYWGGAQNFGWVILGGAHKEGAVVNVVLSSTPHALSEIPMVIPCIAGTQMFVNHPQVVDFLREAYADLVVDLAGKAEGATTVARDKLAEEMTNLAGIQMQETLAALAAGLPTFEVRFEGDEVKVSEGARIPSAPAS